MTGAMMVMINWWGLPMAAFWLLVLSIVAGMAIGGFITVCYVLALGIQYVLGW